MKPVNQKTILITGSTDGIGKIAALELARQNAAVVIHGRNKLKIRDTVEQIKEQTGNEKISGLEGDFSSLAQVRNLAHRFIAEYESLDVLINNAGAGYADSRYSNDGYELRLAVNYIAPFLLTQLLLPVLKRSAPARIINVSSVGQYRIDFNDIMMENKFDPVKAYSQSKLAMIIWSFDLAEELKQENITVNTLHPGTYLDTNMVRNAGIKPWGNAESGAKAVVELAVSSEFENVTGKYFNVLKESKPDPQAYDQGARINLRQFTLDLLKQH